MSHFDKLVRFVDSFCASGHTQVTYDMKPQEGRDEVLEVKITSGQVDIHADTYDSRRREWTPETMRYVRQSSPRTWLYAREGSVSARYGAHLQAAGKEDESSRLLAVCTDPLECIKPDYFVRKTPSSSASMAAASASAPASASAASAASAAESSSPKHAGIFLPLNKFSSCVKSCQHKKALLDQGMLDVDELQFVDQRKWFTVFRYPPLSVIIKHTSINNATFKYLIQEKAMLSYLNDSQRIAVEHLHGGFSPLVLWRVGSDACFENDRFIVYEDGGRPLEVLYFKSGNKVALAELLHIARDLLEALIYLLDKRVVHRNLNPGTVVYRADTGVKLIALGHAKCIKEQLPYEERIKRFEEDLRSSGLQQRLEYVAQFTHPLYFVTLCSVTALMNESIAVQRRIRRLIRKTSCTLMQSKRLRAHMQLFF
jgi:hypothetical protein